MRGVGLPIEVLQWQLRVSVRFFYQRQDMIFWSMSLTSSDLALDNVSSFAVQLNDLPRMYTTYVSFTLFLIWLINTRLSAFFQSWVKATHLDPVTDCLKRLAYVTAHIGPAPTETAGYSFIIDQNLFLLK